MLGGVDWRIKKERDRKRGEGEKERKINKEESDKVIGKLKGVKSASGDGIVREVWKYGGKR